jgi:hypothetical protein
MVDSNISFLQKTISRHCYFALPFDDLLLNLDIWIQPSAIINEIRCLLFAGPLVKPNPGVHNPQSCPLNTAFHHAPTLCVSPPALRMAATHPSPPTQVTQPPSPARSLWAALLRWHQRWHRHPRGLLHVCQPPPTTPSTTLTKLLCYQPAAPLVSTKPASQQIHPLWLPILSCSKFVREAYKMTLLLQLDLDTNKIFLSLPLFFILLKKLTGTWWCDFSINPITHSLKVWSLSMSHTKNIWV